MAGQSLGGLDSLLNQPHKAPLIRLDVTASTRGRGDSEPLTPKNPLGRPGRLVLPDLAIL